MQGVGEWVYKTGSRAGVTGFLWLNFEVEQEPEPVAGEDAFTAVCVELGVASSGDDWVAALNACRDAVVVTLNVLEQAGSIDAYLSERGIKIETGDPPEALAGLGFPLIEAGRFREPVERVAAL